MQFRRVGWGQNSTVTVAELEVANLAESESLTTGLVAEGLCYGAL
jgi:hypothetical protein